MTSSSESPRRLPVVLWAALIVQVACAAFFIWDIMVTVLGLRTVPISWQLHEILEIAASVGLFLGAFLGWRAVRDARARAGRAEAALGRASGAFVEAVDAEMDRWGLTAAERDVAWFTLKGFSLAEIAQMRGTSDGTVKAQTGAIYRKAGVSGKAQLVALFVEDLLNAAPDAGAKDGRREG